MAEPKQFNINAYGRFVSGSITDKRTKDHKNRPIPEDKQNYQFGIAFAKTDPAIQQFFNDTYGYCQAAWATDQHKLQALQGYFTPTQNGYHMQGLSMKVSDGDKPNAQGKVNDNTKGHYVVWCSSGYPPKTCDTAYQEIAPESVKRGYYVAVAGTISDNELPWQADGKGAGIYINGNVVRLLAEGDQIIGGVDPATAFGNAQAPQGQMPAGARALGSGIGAPNGMPGMTPQQGMPQQPNPNVVQGQPQTGGVPMQGVPGVQQNAMPGTASPGSVQMPNAHPGILNGPGGQPQQQAMPQQQQGVPQMGAPANMGMPQQQQGVPQMGAPANMGMPQQ